MLYLLAQQKLERYEDFFLLYKRMLSFCFPPTASLHVLKVWHLALCSQPPFQVKIDSVLDLTTNGHIRQQIHGQNNRVTHKGLGKEESEGLFLGKLETEIIVSKQPIHCCKGNFAWNETLEKQQQTKRQVSVSHFVPSCSNRAWSCLIPVRTQCVAFLIIQHCVEGVNPKLTFLKLCLCAATLKF